MNDSSSSSSKPIPTGIPNDGRMELAKLREKITYTTVILSNDSIDSVTDLFFRNHVVFDRRNKEQGTRRRKSDRRRPPRPSISGGIETPPLPTSTTTARTCDAPKCT